MLFVKNVRLFKAECGEHISLFAKEAIQNRKSSALDIVVEFNGVLMEITTSTTEDDVIAYYREHLN